MNFLEDLKINDEVCIKTKCDEGWAKVLYIDNNLIHVSGYRVFDKNTRRPVKSMGYHAEIIGVKKKDYKG